MGTSYAVIWIDLENHRSVQGVIAEIFNKVRVVDPLAPSCNVTDFSVPDINVEKTPEEADKIIERIKEIFQRGRFVLVLDSLESFCRPSLVHHGLPTQKEEQIRSFKLYLENFYCFLNKLVNISTEKNIYQDSSIVITIDKPRSRHYGSSDDSLKTLDSSLEDFISNLSESSQVRLLEQGDLKYSDLIRESKEGAESGKNLGLEKYTDDFSTYWLYSYSDKPKIDLSRSQSRADSVLWLLKNLCCKTEAPFQQDKDIDAVKNAISALVSLLAFFRQPRTIPMIHSIIQRWVLDIQKKIKDEGKKTSNEDEKEDEKEEKAEQIHEVIARLLDLITGTTNNVDNKENENRYGNKFTNIPANSVPIVAQKHEGGSIWLYREIHEQTYNALTETIHRTDWENDKKGDELHLAAILDGMLAISWHLLIARTYQGNRV